MQLPPRLATLALCAAAAAASALPSQTIPSLVLDGASPRVAVVTTLGGSCVSFGSYGGFALGQPSDSAAGGLTNDVRRGCYWATDGVSLSNAFPYAASSCTFAPSRVLGAASSIGGLAHDPQPDLLLHVESVPVTAALVASSFGRGPCPSSQQTLATWTLPSPTHRATGLSLDRFGGRLFVATARTGRGQVPESRVLVFDWPALGAPQAVLHFDRCTNGPLTAVRSVWSSPGTEYLQITSASTVVGYDYDPAVSATPVERFCQSCTATFGPGSAGRPYGSGVLGDGCVEAGCPRCASAPTLTPTGGLPFVGNSGHAVIADGVPNGSAVLVLLGLGNAGSSFPFACGQLHLSLPALSVGNGVAAGTGCTGSLRVPLPVPNDPSLDGLFFVTQGIFLCPTAGLGLTSGLVSEIAR